MKQIAFTLFLVVILLSSGAKPAQAYDISNEEDFVQRMSAAFNIPPAQVRGFLAVYKMTLEANNITPTPTPIPLPETHDIETSDGKLGFIRAKLSDAVDDGRLTAEQKRQVMDKLEDMMQDAPTTQEFRSMDAREQRVAINEWKNHMESWANARGTSLTEIREITGKGNKFLMGIYY